MKKCMNLIIAFLYYTGFWPPPQGTDELRGALQVWRRLFPRLQLARMVYGIAAQAYNIHLERDSVNSVLEYLAILLIEVKVLICLYILIFRHNEIACVVMYLREKQKEVDEEETTEQRRIVKQTNWITHFLTVLGLVTFGTALTIVAVILIVDGLQRRQVPFRKWFPYDATHTPFFEMTLFTVMATQTVDTTIIVLFDVLFIAIFVQIIGQFVLLNYQLANMHDLVSAKIRNRLMGESLRLMAKERPGLAAESGSLCSFSGKANEKKESNLHTKYELNIPTARNFRFPAIMFDRDLEANRYLQKCVRHHIELLEVSGAASSLLKTPIQYQVFGNAVTCLIVIYIKELAYNFDAKVTVMSGILIACCLELFVFCVLGTILDEYSGKLSLSAFSGNWVGMSRRVKSSLQIIMARTMRGVVFKTFAVLPVTVATFVSVLKFSYSVYAVLTVKLGQESAQARAPL